MARESRVKTDIYRELNNIIEENLQKLPDDVVKKYTKLNGASPVEHFGYLNDKSHFLLSIKEIMEKAPARDLKSPSFMEKVMHLAASGAFGAMGYSAFGSGGIAGGMALPFMFGQAGRKVGESFVRSFQAGRLRNLEKKVLEGVESPFKPILKGLRGASYTKVPYLNEDFQQGEDLVNVRFPRTSKGIMENADTFIASLAQRTNDPNIVEQVRQAVNDQNLLSRLMPQFVNQYPEMFEFDKYGRFDGKFTDPEKRRYANKEIRMDKSKNSFERSVIIDFINRENQLPDQM